MKHILMVDDVTTNLKSAAEVLQPYYQLSMAKSGKQALQFLKKNTPDLILLDLMMPDMDGYETMEQIKLNPMTANVPIIFLTADTEQSSEIKGLKMGAMDFITKPFEAEVMLGRIEKVLMMEDMRKDLLMSSVEDIQTGLLTAKELAKQIDRIIADRNKEHSFGEQNVLGTAVMIDLDNFHRYNESYGRLEGDRLLKGLADCLKKWKTEMEAYQDALLGRLEDDKYMIFLPYKVEVNNLAELCGEELPNMIKDLLPVDLNQAVEYTASLAAAYLYGFGMNYEALYQNLQRAMYHIKQSGKNSWHLYRDKNFDM